MVEATRLSLDLQAKATATALEERAERALVEALGKEAVKVFLTSNTSRGRLTGWRWRMFRDLAKARGVTEAIKAHHEAGVVYWQIALRHERLVRTYARRHAEMAFEDIDTALPVMWEAAYTAALLWEPQRASFSTTLAWYARAAWQRAPERHAVVIPGETREIRAIKGGFGSLRKATISLDTPVEDGGMGGDVEDAQEARECPLDVARLRQSLSGLSARQHETMVLVLEGLNNVDIANRLGCSREYVRQVRATSLQRLRLALGVTLSAE